MECSNTTEQYTLRLHDKDECSIILILQHYYRRDIVCFRDSIAFTVHWRTDKYLFDNVKVVHKPSTLSIHTSRIYLENNEMQTIF